MGESSSEMGSDLFKNQNQEAKKLRKSWDSRAARVNQETRRKSKLMMLGVDFRTRKHGTPAQVGQKFPVEAGAKLPLPKIHLSKAYSSKTLGISKKALKEAQKMGAAGLSGYTVVVRLKTGAVQTIPIVASSWDDFLGKIKGRLKGVDTKQIREISIAGGGKFDLEGVGRWLGHSAKIVGMGLARGERYMQKGAETLGHIAATPKRLQEAYRRGYEGKPENKPETTSVKEWGERAAKPFLKYANIEDIGPLASHFRAGSATRAIPVRERIARLLKRKTQTFGVPPFLRSKYGAQAARLQELDKEAEVIERTASEYGGLAISPADKMKLNARLIEIEREVTRMGGKRNRR